jgi:hypothetical protein
MAAEYTIKHQCGHEAVYYFEEAGWLKSEWIRKHFPECPACSRGEDESLRGAAAGESGPSLTKPDGVYGSVVGYAVPAGADR